VVRRDAYTIIHQRLEFSAAGTGQPHGDQLLLSGGLGSQ
jgi:hypothetical protein